MSFSLINSQMTLQGEGRAKEGEGGGGVEEGRGRGGEGEGRCASIENGGVAAQ